MKRIILGMLATTIAFSTMAQKTESKSTPKESVEAKSKLNDKKLEQLNLSAEQKEKMKAINAVFKKNMDALKSNTTISDNDKKLKRAEMIKDHKSQIKSILTPEQQEKAKEIRKEVRDEKLESEKKGRIEHFTKELNLSPDQSQKIEAINASFKQKMTAVKNNATLSEEQKKEQIKSLMQGHKADIESVLTDAQKEQLKKLKKGRHHKEDD